MPTITIPHEWQPRDYQMPLWHYMLKGGKRAGVCWHRRAGKDLFAINLIATMMTQRPGLYWHLFPTYNQGRKVAWDGYWSYRLPDGKMSSRKFTDAFPKQFVTGENNVEMKMRIDYGNGSESVYQVVGCDDVDKLVGSNPVGCVFSEWSLMNPKAWDLIRPILAENGGWALFIFTPRGRNHAYQLITNYQKDETCFSQILTIEDTKAVSPESIEKERAEGMPEELIQQEFYCSFEAMMQGAYYISYMNKLKNDGKITDVPYDPRLEVHTAWDLGMNDSTTIWFFQTDRAGNVRVIDFYQNSGEGLAHYVNVLKNKDYSYGTHYGPHDLEVRELTADGKSRLEVARELGIRFRVIPKYRVEDGIEATRIVLPRCWFDARKCEKGIEALCQYHKEYDEMNRVYKSKPVHDWTSHAADAFRYLSLGFKENMSREERRPDKALDEYDMFH